jgi:hypothetical protein
MSAKRWLLVPAILTWVAIGCQNQSTTSVKPESPGTNQVAQSTGETAEGLHVTLKVPNMT